jgi:paraquat-inducible protein B
VDQVLTMLTTEVPAPPPPAEEPPSATRSRLAGAFALLGLLLILGALALLGSGRGFGERRTFVVFFPNPVGLRAGAPVTFRQAPLGEVRQVELVFTGRGFESETMVVFDIRRGALRGLKGGASTLQGLDDRAFAATLNEAGLRGTVRSSSPVGGSRSLDFDFHPEIEGRLTGIASPHPELASGSQSRLDILQGKLERALESVSELPLQETIEQARSTLASAQALLDGGDLKGALANLRRVLDTADRVLARSEKTMDRVDGLVGEVGTTLSGARDTMKAVDGTLARLDGTLATVDRNVERTAETQYQTVRSIDELNELLRSVRLLVDTLQRQPEALLRGKPEPKKEKD